MPLNRIWSLGHTQDCIFCLGKDTLQFRITKHGGPMLHCHACGTRCFIHGRGTVGPEVLFGRMVVPMHENKPDVARAMLGIVQQEQEKAEVADGGAVNVRTG